MRVNKRWKLDHPLDKSSAIELIRILRKNGVHLDPDETAQFVMSEHGWQQRDAERFKTLITDVYLDKRLHCTKGRWAKDIFETWSGDQSGEEKPRRR
jgi:hypothetical protein